MILLIDNYDSFSYNLVQMIGGFRKDIRVVRNDELTVEQAARLRPSHIILSPGPGFPKSAGICEELVRKLKGTVPILGVCLGHQGICEAFGGKIIHAKELMHSKQSRIHLNHRSKLFSGLPSEMQAGRYHSLIAERETLPEELLIIAEDEKQEIMAVQHRDYEIYGLQFHPESILTPQGAKIIQNFLSIGGESI
jgi:anthranilate synthase component 2